VSPEYRSRILSLSLTRRSRGFKHEPEPHIGKPSARSRQKLDQLTGVRYQRLRKGLWVAAEGMV
jgi:hypothetical protein